MSQTHSAETIANGGAPAGGLPIPQTRAAQRIAAAQAREEAARRASANPPAPAKAATPRKRTRRSKKAMAAARAAAATAGKAPVPATPQTQPAAARAAPIIAGANPLAVFLGKDLATAGKSWTREKMAAFQATILSELPGICGYA